MFALGWHLMKWKQTKLVTLSLFLFSRWIPKVNIRTNLKNSEVKNSKKQTYQHRFLLFTFFSSLFLFILLDYYYCCSVNLFFNNIIIKGNKKWKMEREREKFCVWPGVVDHTSITAWNLKRERRKCPFGFSFLYLRCVQ